MASIKLTGDTSGEITISAPAVAGTNTLTLPAHTGTVMVDGPAFRASASGSQTLSNTTFTKITFDTEIFDTNSNYDTSLSRFTPTVAGYYYIHGVVRFTATTASKVIVARIYKNGTYYTAYEGVTGTSDSSVQTSALVYCNGTTDYIEFYSYQNSGGNLSTGSYGNGTVVFEGYFVRAA